MYEFSQYFHPEEVSMMWHGFISLRYLRRIHRRGEWEVLSWQACRYSEAMQAYKTWRTNRLLNELAR